ncbi:molybdopterin-dependent oxidoreductase [Desulfovibrio oxyclinae]|uniref:molybdopterin-dependent oxidoreductase n=1 Tax=Desulfovibrio oxyclinae TaxID=63560 RepID=UPI0003640BA1|nr:molybdopterin-dependent oxidoreductase [Desulfovibrio oxyclinae]
MTHSACTFDCPDSCSWLVDTDTRKIRGNPEHPFTNGFACPKGQRIFRRIEAEDRITTPLLRRNGQFEPIDWAEALALCAEKLNSVQGDPQKALHLRGFGYRGVLGMASVAFFNAFGATRTHGSLCDDTGIAACEADFGVLTHNDPSDIPNARRIVNWGKDFNRSSIHTAALIRQARKNGASVLTVSIGGDDTASLSDTVIRIRPGTDRFLAAAVLALLLRENRVGKDMLTRCANTDEFARLVKEQDITTLCRACDVSFDAVRTLAEWYADESPLTSIIGWGLQRHLHGGESVRFINALSVLSGHIGSPGNGVYYNISSNRNFTKWKADGPHDGPTRSFLVPQLARELENAAPAVEFCWIDGFNPANQVPDAVAAARALKRIPFTVCVEAFMTDTAMRADLILPPALTMEREDILGSALHNYVNHSAKLMEPRDEARSDFEILRELGARLTTPITFPDAETCLRSSLQESGIDLDDLRETGFARGDWPQIAFEDLRFGHEDGLYHLPETLSDAREHDANYPLMLMTLVRREAIHSQIPEEEQAEMLTARISPDNPMLKGLNTADPALLETEAGSMRVMVAVEEGIHPQTVILRRGGWMRHGRNPNAVIADHVTDMGGGAAYYSQYCTLKNG